jgi:abortive infection bacteriophage resistance protein
MEEKGATSVDAQIAILESRGMKIENLDKAKEILLDIGYFRLGFYWFPFEKTYPKKVNRDHKFKDGTKLSYAVELYYFDFDLRNLFLPYISRIEINFRTKLIYYASNRYKEDPFWYLNDKYLNKEFIESKLYKGAVEEACKEPVAMLSFCCTFASGISSALDYYMFSYCTLKGNDEACPRGQAFFIYARMPCRCLIIFSS